MEPFAAQLTELCRAHPTRAKWVFVPAHAIGRTLGDRLVLAGTDWANLRFVTPFEIALRMGAPFLVERGIDPSEEGLGPALIMRLLLDLPEEGGYFRPLASQPSMAAALWTTIRELRMAGVRAGGSDAGRVRVVRQARGARRAPDRVRVVPDDERARRPRDRVRGSAATPRLVSDPAARLLDDPARTSSGRRSSAGCSTRCRASASCRGRSRCRASHRRGGSAC